MFHVSHDYDTNAIYINIRIIAIKQYLDKAKSDPYSIP